MRRGLVRIAAVGLGLALVLAACGNDNGSEATDTTAATEVTDTTAASVQPSVEITAPADGAQVTSPVTVEMAATGVVIEPAGEVREGAGHFHVMVDVGCVTPGETIPGDVEGYNHYGQAQTTAELDLTPGEHTLCLQLGDGAHTALGLADTITVTVVE